MFTIKTLVFFSNDFAVLSKYRYSVSEDLLSSYVPGTGDIKIRR